MAAQDFTGRPWSRTFLWKANKQKWAPHKVHLPPKRWKPIFAEQVILCAGGCPNSSAHRLKPSYQTAITPEIAYQLFARVCPILSLMEKHGIEGMRRKISDTARFEQSRRGKESSIQKPKTEMNNVLSETNPGNSSKSSRRRQPGFSQTEISRKDDAQNSRKCTVNL